MSSQQQFIQKNLGLAESVGRSLGVSPDALLAQWGVETGWGRSVIPGTNNLGNIKDFSRSGTGVSATDNMTGSRDRYRQYDSPEAFGMDFVGLIGGNPRYQAALNTGDDVEAFARGLQAGGYAEDPDYVRKLVATAESVRRSRGLGDRIAAAVLPSAQAASNPFDQFDTEESDLPPNVPDNRPPPPGNPFDRFDAAEEAPSSQRVASSDLERNALVGLGAGLGAGVGQVALGAQRYLGQGLQALGLDQAGGWLVNDADQGRANLKRQLAPYEAESPIAAGGGELVGNIAATLPVGGGLAAIARSAAPASGAGANVLNRLAQSLQTGGVQVGAGQGSSALGNAALRAAGGGATGAASAGLVNENDVGLGAAVGAGFPVVGRLVGAGAQAAGQAFRGGAISEPVRALAQRAQQLGIEIPADRIANSRPLNAVASGLNYVPFSGRAGVEDRIQGQLNRAISRTVGQDSDNVTQALRQANNDLGAEFDRVLQGTAVRVDNQLLNDLATAEQRAINELGRDQAAIITRQIDDILGKGGQGQIDGQAAYNIKRTLDRIGKRNSPEAFYADDLRRNLMDALNRSLGPAEAQAFARTRQQYGNMLSLERLAQNGAEGDISAARLANMRNIRSPELQELADISAQFLRPRESQHSAAQRAFAGLGATVLGGPAALAGGAVAGRGLNTLLDSALARNSVLGQANAPAITNSLMQLLPLTSRAAPVISAQ